VIALSREPETANAISALANEGGYRFDVQLLYDSEAWMEGIARNVLAAAVPMGDVIVSVDPEIVFPAYTLEKRKQIHEAGEEYTVVFGPLYKVSYPLSIGKLNEIINAEEPPEWVPANNTNGIREVNGVIEWLHIAPANMSITRSFFDYIGRCDPLLPRHVDTDLSHKLIYADRHDIVFDETLWAVQLPLAVARIDGTMLDGICLEYIKRKYAG